MDLAVAWMLGMSLGRMPVDDLGGVVVREGTETGLFLH